MPRPGAPRADSYQDLSPTSLTIWFTLVSSTKLCILLCSHRGLLLVPCFFLSPCIDLNPMGHSCAVASASAKPQSTCPLHGAAVSDAPGVRVPHQLPWVPPGCGNDPQSLLHHDTGRGSPWTWPPGLPSGPWVMWQTPRWGGNRSEEDRSGPGQLGGRGACLPAPPLNVDAQDVLEAPCPRRPAALSDHVTQSHSLRPSWGTHTGQTSGELAPLSHWDLSSDIASSRSPVPATLK